MILELFPFVVISFNVETSWVGLDAFVGVEDEELVAGEDVWVVGDLRKWLSCDSPIVNG